MENTENIMFPVMFSVICLDPTRRYLFPMGGGDGAILHISVLFYAQF